MHQVGHQQQTRRRFGNAGPSMSRELKQSVEDKELNARARDNFFGRYTLEHSFQLTLCSLIAVADGFSEQIPLGIHQAVIHAPTVNADAVNRPSDLLCPPGRFSQSCFDLAEDVGRVPTQMPVPAAWWILKSMHLFQPQLARRHTG